MTNFRPVPPFDDDAHRATALAVLPFYLAEGLSVNRAWSCAVRAARLLLKGYAAPPTHELLGLDVHAYNEERRRLVRDRETRDRRFAEAIARAIVRAQTPRAAVRLSPDDYDPPSDADVPSWRPDDQRAASGAA